MTDCAFSLNAMAGAGYLAGGAEPGREGQMLNGGSFYDYYRSRDGRWMSVGGLEPGFMQPCARRWAGRSWRLWPVTRA